MIDHLFFSIKLLSKLVELSLKSCTLEVRAHLGPLPHVLHGPDDLLLVQGLTEGLHGRGAHYNIVYPILSCIILYKEFYPVSCIGCACTCL